MAEHLNGGNSNRLSNGLLPARMKPSIPSSPQQGPISPVPSWKLYQNPFYDGLHPRNAKHSRSGNKLAGIDPSSSGIHFDPAVMISVCKQSPHSRCEQPETQVIHTEDDDAAHLREHVLASSALVRVKAQPLSTASTVSEPLEFPSVLPNQKYPQIASASKRALGTPEPEEREKAIATTLDASYGLNETPTRVNSVEDNRTVSMSLFSTLQVELENASTRLQELELSQKSVLSEIDGLLNKIGEELTMSRRAKHDRIIQEALEHLLEENEEEKDAASILLKIEREDLSDYEQGAKIKAAASAFDVQEIAGGLIAEDWNELVREIEEDKIGEELKQEQATVREEAEEERKLLLTAEELLPEEKVETKRSEAQLGLESKSFETLEDLKSKLEAFVEAIRRCSQEQPQIEQAEIVRKTLELLQEGSGSLHSNAEASETNKIHTEKAAQSNELYRRLGESDHGIQLDSEANECKYNLSNCRKQHQDHGLSNFAWHEIGNNEIEKASVIPVDLVLHHHASSSVDSHSAWLLDIAPAAHHLHPSTSSNEASSLSDFPILQAPTHHRSPRAGSPSQASNSSWPLDPSPPAHPLPLLERNYLDEAFNSAAWHIGTGKATNQDRQQQPSGRFLNPVAGYHGLCPDTEWKKLLFDEGKHPPELQPDDHTSSISGWRNQTRSDSVEKKPQQSYSPHHDHRFVDPASAHHHQHQSHWKELLSPDSKYSSMNPVSADHRFVDPASARHHQHQSNWKELLSPDSKHASMKPKSADHDYSMENWHSSSSEGVKKLQQAPTSHYPAGTVLGRAPAFLYSRPQTKGQEFLATHSQRKADRKPAWHTAANSAWRIMRSEVERDRQRLQASGTPRHHSRSLLNPLPANRLLYPESRWKDFCRHPEDTLQQADQTQADIDWHKRHVQDPSRGHAPARPQHSEALYRAPHSEYWHSCCDVKNQHELQSPPNSRLHYNPDRAHYLRHHIGSSSFAAPNSACNACTKVELDCKEQHQLQARSPERHSTGRFLERGLAQYHHRQYANTRATPEPDFKSTTQQHAIISPDLSDHQHLLHQQRIPLLQMPQPLPTPEVGCRPPQRRLWQGSPPPDANSTFASHLKGLNADKPKFSERSSMHAQLLEASRQTSDGIEKPIVRGLRFSSFRRSGRSN